MNTHRLIALANSTEDVADLVCLENELALDNDGWALLAPFGEHAKIRVIRDASGNLREQTFVQIFDEPAVDAILANEKGEGLFARLKRALIKRPIFEGHPDLKQYAPETVTSDTSPAAPIGLNDGCRKTARGLEFKPQLTPEGAAAVEKRGCKFPSGLFLFKKTGVIREGNIIEVRPFKVASIGLTPFPNISGVDSLANAREAAAKQTENQNQNENTMKQILIGWLAAQGIPLANDAADQAVFDAFLKANSTQVANITALGNDKTTLGGKVAALEADLGKEKKRADDATLALSNAQTESTNLRKQFMTARVDLAITQGKAPLADRAAEITSLENSKALDADLEKLDKRPVKFPVASGMAERKGMAAASTAALALANEIETLVKSGKTKGQALDHIIKTKPKLHEAYLAEGGSIAL